MFVMCVSLCRHVHAHNPKLMAYIYPIKYFRLIRESFYCKIVNAKVPMYTLQRRVAWISCSLVLWM